MDQFGVGENPKVLTDGRPADIEMLSDVGHGALIIANQTKDLSSPWFGEGPDSCIHPHTIDNSVSNR